MDSNIVNIYKITGSQKAVDTIFSMLVKLDEKRGDYHGTLSFGLLVEEFGKFTELDQKTLTQFYGSETTFERIGNVLEIEEVDTWTYPDYFAEIVERVFPDSKFYYYREDLYAEIEPMTNDSNFDYFNYYELEYNDIVEKFHSSVEILKRLGDIMAESIPRDENNIWVNLDNIANCIDYINDELIEAGFDENLIRFRYVEVD